MDLILASIVLLLVFILYLPFTKSYRKKRAISAAIDHLPGPKKYPVIGTALGHILSTREKYWDMVKCRHPTYGPIFRSWLGSSLPVVHIYKAEHVQIILKSQVNINKGVMYKYFIPWLGQGLVVGSGSIWKRHRKVITPAFHFKILDKYAEVFAEKGKQFADMLEERVGTGFFDVSPLLNKVALDIICETAMGVNLNFIGNPHSEYANAIVQFGTSIHKRLYHPIYKHEFLYQFTSYKKEVQRHLDLIHDFNKKIIEDRREKVKQAKAEALDEDVFKEKGRLAFLDMLLANQEVNQFSDKEIEDEVNTFMFGGHDTTAATLCWTLLALATNPDIQDKVQQELDSIFEGSDRLVTPQDVGDMAYLDRVIKEVLRFYTFIPFLPRELVEGIVIDGHKIPAGVTVIMSLYDLHHDQEQFPDPDKFDPDRFLPEEVAKRHPFAFAPFSAGARNCIGQKFGLRNSKTILSYILRKYRVTSLEKPEDMRYYLEVVLRPQNGLHIALELR